MRLAFSSASVALVLLLASGCGDSGSGGTGGTGATPLGGGGSSSNTGGEGGSGNAFTTGGGGAAAGSGGTGGQAEQHYCGDGVKDMNEACDDGNAVSGDGCTGTCDAIENGFACLVPGEDCISTVVCGDGNITGAETCDDQNVVSGDGCDSNCTLEAGWVCPEPGVACEAAGCGDHVIAGTEQCEDGNTDSGDGCSSTCRLEPGFKCDVIDMPCVPTVCGDGVKEGSEQCDDGNNDFGDLCSPLYCTAEPNCSGSPASACTTTCGDGIKLPNDPTEECEDGNTVDGDGCSSTCKEEPGYTCVPDMTVPTELVLPVVLRDFKVAHPDFEDFLGDDLNIVQLMLGADGKPQYAGSPTTATTSGKTNFDQWYRDVANTNLTVLQTLTLGQLPSGQYQFNNSNFFPLDGLGFGNEGNGHNFHFTSEVRYWFEYKGNEQLDFTGDDDVWVFVNKRRAINLGGVHGAESASITLNAANATTFQLQTGSVYEIVVFQAERHTTQSNYRLTLSNFTNQKTVCTSFCGDGIKTPDEQCDDMTNDGSYGHCAPGCVRGPRCGDGIQQPEEECDDGANITPYGGCAPGCVLGAFCGDGGVDSVFGEQCDDGVNDGGYGECAAGCVLGPRCGDGIKQSPQEQCDDGNTNNSDNCHNDCTENIAG
ncbi:MAG: DUF4215 domain-containing protein [Polyangiaceae bacterium]